MSDILLIGLVMVSAQCWQELVRRLHADMRMKYLTELEIKSLQWFMIIQSKDYILVDIQEVLELICTYQRL